MYRPFDESIHARTPPAAADPYSVALGDVDGDGDLDMIFANDGQNRLYLNLLRHLDSPSPVTNGGNYQLDVYARYGPAGSGTAAVPLISGAKAQIPTPFGTLGLDPLLMVALPTVVIPQPAGVYSIILPVPNLPRGPAEKAFCCRLARVAR